MCTLLPHNHLNLDEFNAAVLLTILGLTLSFFIQALVDSCFILGRTPAFEWLGLGMEFLSLSSYQSACLSRGINAEAVSGHHRSPPGLLAGRVLCVAAILIFIGAISLYLSTAVPISGPIVDFARDGALPVVAEVGGHIRSVYVAEGSIVNVGDPLVQLNTSALLLKKHSLESQIHFLELAHGHNVTELKNAYRDLRQTEVDLDRFTITSPVDGVITLLGSIRADQDVAYGTVIAVIWPRQK